MSEDRRDPDYHPSYMREPSIRPANHQLDVPTYWWLFPPLWPFVWMQAVAEVLSGDDRRGA